MAEFLLFFQDFLQYFHNLMQLLQDIESIYHQFYRWNLLKLWNLFIDICSGKIKLLTLIDVSSQI